MITQASTSKLDSSHSQDVLAAAYRQVFGNRHMMELDVLPSIDALFMNGDLTVQGLVTALAQSDTYRRLFLKPIARTVSLSSISSTCLDVRLGIKLK